MSKRGSRHALDGLQGLLPSGAIAQAQSEIEREAAEEKRKRREKCSKEREPSGGVVLSWCGDPHINMEVWVDGDMQVAYWNHESQGNLRLPMAAGEHECCVRRKSGEPLWEGSVVAAEGAWSRIDFGELFDKVASDPKQRSQFSFEGGQSACSFLCCDVAALLWEKLVAAADDTEIQGAEITGQHIEEALSRAMTRYVDGPRDTFSAMGLEHTSVLEVLEFCSWVWNAEWVAAADGSFWGSLAEEQAVLDSLLQAANHAKSETRRMRGSGGGAGVRCMDGGGRGEPIFVAMTRPPETVLLILGSSGGAGEEVIGVFDPHTRMIGSKQYPASFYHCKSLGQLADLLRHTFFPLPQDLHPEELGNYVLFELNIIRKQRPALAAPSAAHQSAEALGEAPPPTAPTAPTAPTTETDGVGEGGSDEELDPDAVDLTRKPSQSLGP
jgi:hypothetical protein